VGESDEIGVAGGACVTIAVGEAGWLDARGARAEAPPTLASLLAGPQLTTKTNETKRLVSFAVVFSLNLVWPIYTRLFRA
jgi:hypothetical protein